MIAVVARVDCRRADQSCDGICDRCDDDRCGNRCAHRDRDAGLERGAARSCDRCGSLVLSHVNDAGFWLIKEFFNMTVPQTLKTWTVAETIIGVAGLAFTLLLSLAV